MSDAERVGVESPGQLVKPRFRGSSHKFAFFVSLIAGLALILAADSSRKAWIALIYAFSLSALLGTSALYHRVNWNPAQRAWMRRLDHTMIFVLIAGTFTPFALLVLEGTRSTVVLIILWGAVIGGAVLNLLWVNAPKWVSAVLYVGLGWVGTTTVPELSESTGPWCVALLLIGGVLYTMGALVYALKRPNPWPRSFGYHEIFHAFVIAAAAAHYVALAGFVFPVAT
jgi:hemolysin III